MVTRNKLLAFSFTLALVLVMTTGIFAKSEPAMSSNVESVTGMVTEIVSGDRMNFLRIVPQAGDDVWVAVMDNVPVIEGVEYTFEGPAYKNYLVTTSQRTFPKMILSSGPQ